MTQYAALNVSLIAWTARHVQNDTPFNSIIANRYPESVIVGLKGSIVTENPEAPYN